MEYKEFILDDFQVDAIESLDKNHSVVVSAATGTGKTLIADYVINKYIGSGSKIIYTAPIKALSNQKYREFLAEYGDKVGLITGDVVINADAQILIMTTEIYRNMLVTKDEMVNDVSYVIFDEIHYINDIERGVVWEESIIFSPQHVRFLCLSATIPNAHEFADWISTIKEHSVDVVKYDKRAVPLHHHVFDSKNGLKTLDQFRKIVDNNEYDELYTDFGNNFGYKHKHRGGNKRRGNAKKKDHIELVYELQRKNLVPCMFFVFSRKACEDKAGELSRKMREGFTTPDQKSKIIRYMREHLDPEYNNLETVKLFREVLPKGIAFHHAGLLPGLKDVVEHLFNEGLISVLYATETFAVGINMPAKTVAFSSLEKYDGISFRYLNTKEYFQMAGRAGRRGIDTQGYSIALMDKRHNDPEKVLTLMTKDVEKIISQYRLTYNTALNLVNSYDQETTETILKSSFDYYLRQKQHKSVRIMASYKNMLNRLEKWGFILNGEITEKGEFAKYIYQHEILITEVFNTEAVDMLSPIEILCLLATIIYEERKNDNFVKQRSSEYKNTYLNIISVTSEMRYVDRKIDRFVLRKMIPMMTIWAHGADFMEVVEMTNLREGDVIRLIRQVVDFLRQILRATKDQHRIDKLQECMDMIYRDIVRPEF